ncbi:MAG: hypothetical protein WCI52_02560 [bacterium]
MKKFMLIVGLFGFVMMVTGCDQMRKQEEEEARENKAREARMALEMVPNEGRDVLSGTVVKIYGNLPGLEASSISISGKGISGGGDTIKIGEPIYGLHAQTPEGLYVLQMQGNDVYALASLITIGTEIKFPKKFHWQYHVGEEDLFDKNRINFCSDRPNLARLVEIVHQK